MFIKSAVIIDDDPELVSILKDILTEELELKTLAFSSAECFFNGQSEISNSVYLIDWNLPGIKGTEIIKSIRQADQVSPIFMISGNHTLDHVKEGLDAGADDYLIKPFPSEILVKKVRNARLRTHSIMKDSLNYGVKLLPEAGLVIKDGSKVCLTKREFEVFKHLFENPETVHNRHQIVSILKDSETSERHVDVLVFGLRRKISMLGFEIDTIRGQGYRMGTITP